MSDVRSGPPRLAFEIDDDEILAGIEHLPEVKIPVDPRFSWRDLVIEEAREDCASTALAGSHGLGIATRRFRQVRDLAPELSRRTRPAALRIAW